MQADEPLKFLLNTTTEAAAVSLRHVMPSGDCLSASNANLRVVESPRLGLHVFTTAHWDEKVLWHQKFSDRRSSVVAL